MILSINPRYDKIRSWYNPSILPWYAGTSGKRWNISGNALVWSLLLQKEPSRGIRENCRLHFCPWRTWPHPWMKCQMFVLSFVLYLYTHSIGANSGWNFGRVTTLAPISAIHSSNKVELSWKSSSPSRIATNSSCFLPKKHFYWFILDQMSPFTASSPNRSPTTVLNPLAIPFFSPS